MSFGCMGMEVGPWQPGDLSTGLSFLAWSNHKGKIMIIPVLSLSLSFLCGLGVCVCSVHVCMHVLCVYCVCVCIVCVCLVGVCTHCVWMYVLRVCVLYVYVRTYALRVCVRIVYASMYVCSPPFRFLNLVIIISSLFSRSRAFLKDLRRTPNSTS